MYVRGVLLKPILKFNLNFYPQSENEGLKSGSAFLRQQKRKTEKFSHFLFFAPPTPLFLKGIKIFLFCGRREAR